MPNKEQFSGDEETTNTGKNAKLVALLGGPWCKLAVVKIERIKDTLNPLGSGWKVTYYERQ